MADLNAILLGREIPGAKPTLEENELLPFYDDTGKVFTIPGKAEAEYITGISLPEFPIDYKPARIELNVPWSITREPAGGRLQPWVCNAILQQFLAPTFGLTVCDIVEHEATSPESIEAAFSAAVAAASAVRNTVTVPTTSTAPPSASTSTSTTENFTVKHKCDFSRNNATIKIPNTPSGRTLMRIARGLDTVALFQKPVIIRKLYKTQEDFGEDKVRQFWWKEEFCTNCLAAKTPWACSHSVLAGRERAAGTTTMGPFVVERTGRSGGDDRAGDILELETFNARMSSTSKPQYEPPSDIVRPRPHFAVDEPPLKAKMGSVKLTPIVDEPAAFVSYWHLVPVVASVPRDDHLQAAFEGKDSGKASFTTLALYMRVDTASNDVWIMEYKCTVSLAEGTLKTIRWYGERDIAEQKRDSWDVIASESVRMNRRSASTHLDDEPGTFRSKPFDCAAMRRAYNSIVWAEKTKTTAAVGGPPIQMLTRLEPLPADAAEGQLQPSVDVASGELPQPLPDASGAPAATETAPAPSRLPHFAVGAEFVTEWDNKRFTPSVDVPKDFVASWHLMPLLSTEPDFKTHPGSGRKHTCIGLYARMDLASDALWIMEYRGMLTKAFGNEKSIQWYHESEFAAQKRDSWDEIVSHSAKVIPQIPQVSVERTTTLTGAVWRLNPLDCAAIKQAYKAIVWAEKTQTTAAFGGPILHALIRLPPPFAVPRTVELKPEHYKDDQHEVRVDEIVTKDLRAWHMLRLMYGQPSLDDIAVADNGKPAVTALAIYVRVDKATDKLWFMQYEYHGGKDEGQRKTMTWYMPPKAVELYRTKWKSVIAGCSDNFTSSPHCYFTSSGDLDCARIKETWDGFNFAQPKPLPGAPGILNLSEKQADRDADRAGDEAKYEWVKY